MNSSDWNRDLIPSPVSRPAHVGRASLHHLREHRGSGVELASQMVCTRVRPARSSFFLPLGDRFRSLRRGRKIFFQQDGHPQKVPVSVRCPPDTFELLVAEFQERLDRNDGLSLVVSALPCADDLPVDHQGGKKDPVAVCKCYLPAPQPLLCLLVAEHRCPVSVAHEILVERRQEVHRSPISSSTSRGDASSMPVLASETLSPDHHT